MKRQEATLEDFKITWMLAKRLMEHPFQVINTPENFILCK